MKKSNNVGQAKAVGYCRFSSEKQNEESIESQKDRIIAYAERQDILIVGWYCDRATTGTNDKRPEFQQMIADSKKGRFNLVLVNKFDRFARNLDESRYNKIELAKYLVKVVSISEPISNDPSGMLFESILESMAQFYSDNLATEVMRGHERNAKNARHNGGTTPYGFKLIPRTDDYGNVLKSNSGHTLSDMAIEENEAEAVRIVFNGVAASRSYPDLIKELHAKGYRTRNGHKFTNSSLENMLRNEKYCGTYVYNKKTKRRDHGGKKLRVKNDPENVFKKEDGIPAIVSREVFFTVKKIMDARKHSAPWNVIDEYLLSGKITCGECGAVYRSARKKRLTTEDYYNSYKCRARKSDNEGNEIENKCTNCAISRDVIENAVIDRIKSLVLNISNIENTVKSYNDFIKFTSGNNDEAIKKINRQIADVENKINSAIDMLLEQTNKSLADRISLKIDGYEAEKKSLQDRLAEEQRQKSEIVVNHEIFTKSFKTLRELVNSGDPSRRKKLIDLFLNKVLVFHDRIEIFLNVLPSTFFNGKNIEIDIKAIQNIANNNEKHLDEVSLRSPEKVCGSGGRI